MAGLQLGDLPSARTGKYFNNPMRTNFRCQCAQELYLRAAQVREDTPSGPSALLESMSNMILFFLQFLLR